MAFKRFNWQWLIAVLLVCVFVSCQKDLTNTTTRNPADSTGLSGSYSFNVIYVADNSDTISRVAYVYDSTLRILTKKVVSPTSLVTFKTGTSKYYLDANGTLIKATFHYKGQNNTGQYFNFLNTVNFEYSGNQPAFARIIRYDSLQPVNNSSGAYPYSNSANSGGITKVASTFSFTDIGTPSNHIALFSKEMFYGNNYLFQKDSSYLIRRDSARIPIWFDTSIIVSQYLYGINNQLDELNKIEYTKRSNVQLGVYYNDTYHKRQVYQRDGRSNPLAKVFELLKKSSKGIIGLHPYFYQELEVNQHPLFIEPGFCLYPSACTKLRYLQNGQEVLNIDSYPTYDNQDRLVQYKTKAYLGSNAGDDLTLIFQYQ